MLIYPNSGLFCTIQQNLFLKYGPIPAKNSLSIAKISHCLGIFPIFSTMSSEMVVIKNDIPNGVIINK